MAASKSFSLLLELEEQDWLVAVLERLAADDLRSLFSVARSHSKLRRAAMVALQNFKALVSQQQQADSMLVFLGQQGSHVDRIHLTGPEGGIVRIRQLPPNLQLGGLCFDRLHLQLQPGGGFQGVLGAAERIAALKQLQLSRCRLRESDDGLAAALGQLPAGLEALCLASVRVPGSRALVPSAALQLLQRLTSLELQRVLLQGTDEDSNALQPLEELTRLVDLQLDSVGTSDGGPIMLTASLLSSTCQLTRLELTQHEAQKVRHQNGQAEMESPAELNVEPGVLTGKTLLQHLVLGGCTVSGGAAGVSELLSHLQPMQQLTHLSLEGSLREVEQGISSPTALHLADEQVDSENSGDEGGTSGVTGVDPPGRDASWDDTPVFPKGNQGTNPPAAPASEDEPCSEGLWDFEEWSDDSEYELESYDHIGAANTNPPAAAYAALTASSKLQHLSVVQCVLPAGAWQYMFPAGRQLLHLTSLDMSSVEYRAEYHTRRLAPAPDISLLVSCCPCLQGLNMEGMMDSAEQLPALQGFSGLTKLALTADHPSAAEGVCQLTGLKELRMEDVNLAQGLLMQLTELQQLTRLSYTGLVIIGHRLIKDLEFTRAHPSDEPIWRQIVQAHQRLQQQAHVVVDQVALALAE